MSELYVDLGVSPAGVSGVLGGKLGESLAVKINFKNGGVAVGPPAGVYQMEVKERGQYGAEPLLRVVEFVVVDAAVDYLTCEVLLDSEALRGLFSGCNAVRQLMVELAWVSDGVVGKTVDYQLRLSNDIIKELGGDAVPVPDSPVVSSGVTAYDGVAIAGFAGGSLNDLLVWVAGNAGVTQAEVDATVANAISAIDTDLSTIEFKGVVADEAAMLAVTGERGDWVKRGDLGNQVFKLVADDASLVASWVPFERATKASLGLSEVDNTSDADKPVSEAQAADINGKVNTGIDVADDAARLTLTGLSVGQQVTVGDKTYVYRGNLNTTPSANEANEANWEDLSTERKFNVKSFNAKGDDVADDTAAIQQAIDAAALSKGTVYFPDGVYRVTKSAQTGIGEDKQALNLHSNITLHFESTNVILKPLDSAPANMPVLMGQVGNCDAITFINVAVDGNKDRISVDGGGNSEDEGINLKSSNYCRFINCEVYNCGQDGIDLDGGSYATIWGGHIHDNWGNGIHMAGTGMVRGLINGTVIRNNAHGRYASSIIEVQASASGIDNKGGSDNTISNVISLGNARGYTCYGAVRTIINGGSFNDGNTTGGAALYLRGASGSGSGSINVNGVNIISGTAVGSRAVYIDEGFADASFVGGYIRGRDGIVVGDGGKLTLSASVVMDSTQHNIHLIENRNKRVDLFDVIHTASHSGNAVRVECDAYGTINGGRMEKSGSSITGIDFRTGSGNFKVSGVACDTTLRAVRISAGTHVLTDNDFAGKVEVATDGNQLINNRIHNLTMSFVGSTDNVYKGNCLTGTLDGTSHKHLQVWSGNYGAGAPDETGVATLVAGTATVASDIVPAGAKVALSRQSSGGTLGHLSLGTVTAGTSLVITSDSTTETSDILWEILN